LTGDGRRAHRHAGWAIFAGICLTVGCAGRIHQAPPHERPAPEAAALVSSLSFIATAYCRGTTTAAGTAVMEGIVAADPRLLPLGTTIRINGPEELYSGVYRVMDTGSKIRGHRIDLYIGNCAEARRFGRRSVRVDILRMSRPQSR
jgi:3D (Asp-Asp-Asp) domain-containing protein